MNSSAIKPAPLVCDEQTDLLPFLTYCQKQASEQNTTIFSSITFETNFCDPLAIMEQVHQELDGRCYLEKPTDEFSVACGDPVYHASFRGDQRFQEAKPWSQKFRAKVHLSGDNQIGATAPTLILISHIQN